MPCKPIGKPAPNWSMRRLCRWVSRRHAGGRDKMKPRKPWIRCSSWKPLSDLAEDLQQLQGTESPKLRDPHSHGQTSEKQEPFHQPALGSPGLPESLRHSPDARICEPTNLGLLQARRERSSPSHQHQERLRKAVSLFPGDDGRITLAHPRTTAR